MIRIPSQKTPNTPSRKKILGQGMTEYIIIVGVIAIAAIGVFGYFGDVVEQQVAGMASELSGGDGSASQGAAATSAGAAVTEAAQHNDLSNYSGQNNPTE